MRKQPAENSFCKHFCRLACAALLLATLSSCATYTIPLTSFREQFSGMDAATLRDVTVVGPTGMREKYKTFPVTGIKCVDKHGQPATLKVSPSIEMRVTDTAGRRTVFYFDQIFVNRQTIRGMRSRFLGLPKTIPFTAIRKIEVQDGHKKFRYAQ